MDSELANTITITMLILGVVTFGCISVREVQTTNRKLVEAGYSYRPINVTTYSSGWVK